MRSLVNKAAHRVEQWLEIPPTPAPPWGDPGSVRIFRPGRGFLKLLLVHWVFTEGWAIALGLVTLLAPHWIPDFRWLSWLTADFMIWIEIAFFLFLPVILPIAFLKILLDYRNRWYILTDRSLRLREGVWTVREMTISLSNVQNVALRQGPIQRLLGIADVEVHTAGGGESIAGEEAASHRGLLRGITDAQAIRDAILAASRKAIQAPEQASSPNRATHADPSIVIAARNAAKEAEALVAVVATRS